MPRRTRTLLLAATLGAVLALLPTCSASAARSVPQGFYGVNYSGNVELLSSGAQTKLWDKIATGGAESVRLLFNWDLAERVKGYYKWGRIDSLVTNAAKRGMEMLPVVEYAPNWAKKYPSAVQSPPSKAHIPDYTRFLQACIRRYGPNGSFWKSHPTLRKMPIHDWEIWNEPEIAFHWYRGPQKRPWGPSDAQLYVDLLKASYTTVHTTDPLSPGRVVLAALSIDAPQNLQRLYDWTDIEGPPAHFDVAAIQAYAGKPTYFPTLIGGFRDVLNGHGAIAAPIYVTEMTWPAAKGIAHPHYTTGYMSGFLTDQKGAAARLTNGYRILSQNRSKFNIQRVFWYTAVSAYASTNEYEYSGLLTYKNSKVKAFPVFGAYQASAQAAEGCAKNALGNCR